MSRLAATIGDTHHASRLRAFEGDVEEPAAPQLERQNRPQVQIEIAAALVQPQQPLDVADVEESALAAGVRQQDVARESEQLAAEPARQRHGEALLRAGR